MKIALGLCIVSISDPTLSIRSRRWSKRIYQLNRSERIQFKFEKNEFDGTENSSLHRYRRRGEKIVIDHNYETLMRLEIASNSIKLLSQVNSLETFPLSRIENVAVSRGIARFSRPVFCKKFHIMSSWALTLAHNLQKSILSWNNSVKTF